MGLFDSVGNRIDDVTTLREGGYSYWRVRLDQSSAVELTVVVQDGAGVYVQTMSESEFQHFQKGTHRVLTDLSASNFSSFRSGAVNLPAGEYRVIVGLERVQDHWDDYSKVAVRFETLR